MAFVAPVRIGLAPPTADGRRDGPDAIRHGRNSSGRIPPSGCSPPARPPIGSGAARPPPHRCGASGPARRHPAHGASATALPRGAAGGWPLLSCSSRRSGASSLVPDAARPAPFPTPRCAGTIASAGVCRARWMGGGAGWNGLAGRPPRSGLACGLRRPPTSGPMNQCGK